ncbi:MAG: hypothetical protein M0Z77_00315 [Thermoplasmatales archaeon]|nr:hypothetical protein [Thermoplasmatales archaeon]
MIRKGLPRRKTTKEYMRINGHSIRQLNYLRHINPGLLKVQSKGQSRVICPKTPVS